MLYEAVSKRSSVVDGLLSVDELNGILDELSQNMGKQYARVWWQEECIDICL